MRLGSARVLSHLVARRQGDLEPGNTFPLAPESPRPAKMALRASLGPPARFRARVSGEVFPPCSRNLQLQGMGSGRWERRSGPGSIAISSWSACPFRPRPSVG